MYHIPFLSLCRDGSNDIHLESFLDRAEQAEVRKVVVRHADMTFIILTATLHSRVVTSCDTPIRDHLNIER